MQLASGTVLLLQTTPGGGLQVNRGSGSPLVWSGWTSISLGFHSYWLLSNPAAVSWDGSRVDVFAWAEFFSVKLYHLWSTDGGTTWNRELLRGFAGADTTQAAVVVSRKINQLDIFANGAPTPYKTSFTQSALYYEHWNGTSWSTWQSLGGPLVNFYEAPGAASFYTVPAYAVVTPSASQLVAFGTGTDQGLYADSLTGTNWSGWTSLGGFLTSNPTATIWGYGFLSVCVLGGEFALWCRDDALGTWGSWYELGGTFGGAPLSIASDQDSLDVFAISTAFPYPVWHREGSFDPTCTCLGWDPWESLGAPLV